MFYAAFEQTIPAADHHHQHQHHHHLPSTSLGRADDYWYNNTNPVPSYTCPYDTTQRLCLAKLTDEDAFQQWQLLQDDAPAPTLEEVEGKEEVALEQDEDVPSSSSSSSALSNHCCRLRLGPLVPLHEDDTNDIDPATTTTAPSTSSSSSFSPSSLQPPPKKRARFLVVYEQPLSDTSKPQLYQDIPVLLGPAEDAVAAPAPGDDDDGDDGDEDDNDDDNDNDHSSSSLSSSSSCLHVLKCLIDSAVYQNDRSLLWLSAWPTREAAVRYVQSIDRTVEDRVDLVRISRDYESSSSSFSSSSSSGDGSGIGNGVVGVAMSGCDGSHTCSTETSLK